MQNRSCRVWACALKVTVGVVLALTGVTASGAVNTTTVQGTVYRADGTPASGTVLISWPAFTTADNQAVAAGSLSVPIGANGFVSVNLAPNAGAIPAGSYYTAVYHLNDGTVNPEYWVIPASGTATISSVRAKLEPSTVAVQGTVTPAYVQGALNSLSNTYLPLAGGTLNGPLTLGGDPSADGQAATKHYADQLAAQELPLTGGKLKGPLTAPSLNVPGTITAGSSGQFSVDSSGNVSTAGSVTTGTLLPGITIKTYNLASCGYANPPSWCSGSDLGAWVNAAKANLGSGKAVFLVPAGTYTWSTPATVDPLYISVKGDGSSNTVINCTAATCLTLQEATYSIDQAGSVSGLQFVGNGSANQVGVEWTGGVGESWNDDWLQNFSGSGAVALLFNNSGATYGWSERTSAHHLRFDNDTVGWQFQYNTANAAAASFGYSHYDAECNTLNSGQQCINMVGGRIYHSTVTVVANPQAGSTVINDSGDFDSNIYNVTAEGPNTATCINVASGAEFVGYQDVDCSGPVNSNANAPSWFPTLRVVQGPENSADSDSGALPNFLGSGNAATVYMALPSDIGNSWGFGHLEGTNISSEYAAIGNFGTNAFTVLSCASGQPMSSCAIAGSIENNGAYVFGAGAAPWLHYVNGALEYGDGGSGIPFVPNSDAKDDLGAAGNRWAQGYFAGNVNDGVTNATTGYQIGGFANSGHFLRGNGTDYVDSAIQPGDLPASVVQDTSQFSVDASGNVSTAGSVTAAAINGELNVNGAAYKTLNAAWSAAVSQANTTGQDQTIQLGPGSYPVSATLTEPSNGTCVNLLGSGGTTVTADSTQVATTLTVPNALNGDVFSLGNAAQAQGCTFKDFNILAQKNATHGFELQWVRGLLIANVTVNDTTAEGILLGEEDTSAGHQSNFLLRNVTVSYSSAAFTPANRPAYGIHIEKTAIDSDLEDITVRNALTAAVYNEGTGNTGVRIHGFGYPYACTTAPCVNNATSSTAANASYATSYVIYDTGGAGNVWTDTYIDSPAVAGFYIGANGVSINGGHIQWPDLTSFPSANLAYVAANVTNNLLIADVDCLGMSSSANWITYAGTSGNPPTFASVHHLTGCGNYYQALEPAETTGFSSGGANINDASGAVPRVWSTPIAAAANYPAYSAQMYTGYQGDAFQAHFSGVAPFFNITSQGTIRSSGGLALSTIINTTATLTLTTANRNVIANASSGAQTITLPSCYTPLADRASPTGLELTIIKSDASSNPVTLQTVSSQSIDYNGATAQTLTISSPGKRTLICGPDYNWYAY